MQVNDLLQEETLKGGNGGNFLGGFMVLYYLKLAKDHKNIHFRPQKGS